ncbi:hypothetical protein IFT48_25225 [Pseudomonas fluorescens]|uniref:Uncharacterized protein n=1 Tax=Pseudomonas edaphica TaxID=2006980 RepID=A0A7Y7V5J9_9PSED|nr:MULTISPECIES: hypothetical protein [Pseudomonas]MBD8093302.1 hypothetical protein [Pseudomonas fluorescens]MBD8719255.1 hypothetical protein [Pseudomonas fluorescens]NVZ55819.1 hypothetical protein [Pseudomonas edaphica]
MQELIATPQLEVIEYNPWEWTGQEKLSASFFDEVSRAIRRKDKSNDDKKLAKVLRQYGRRINASAELVDGMTRYLPLFLGSPPRHGARSLNTQGMRSLGLRHELSKVCIRPDDKLCSDRRLFRTINHLIFYSRRSVPQYQESPVLYLSGLFAYLARI